MAEQSAGHSAALREVAVLFAELDQELISAGPVTAMQAVADVAARRVAGAEAASITTYRDGQFHTVAATDERAREADEIQYELGSGPCVDAIVDQTLYHPRDLTRDQRWPHFGARVSELGIASMLSYRLRLEQAGEDTVAGLNVYSGRVDAFDDEAVQVGLLLATHAASALSAELARERARNLERALTTNREIGMAMGVLIARHNLTRTQAFDLLRIASQNLNRKINEIAVEVVDTGALPTWRPSRHRGGGNRADQ